MKSQVYLAKWWSGNMLDKNDIFKGWDTDVIVYPGNDFHKKLMLTCLNMINYGETKGFKPFKELYVPSDCEWDRDFWIQLSRQVCEGFEIHADKRLNKGEELYIYYTKELEGSLGPECQSLVIMKNDENVLLGSF